MFTLDKQQMFEYNCKVHEILERNNDSIKGYSIKSSSVFAKINITIKFPEYYKDYSFYRYYPEKYGKECTVEIEKV